MLPEQSVAYIPSDCVEHFAEQVGVVLAVATHTPLLQVWPVAQSELELHPDKVEVVTHAPLLHVCPEAQSEFKVQPDVDGAVVHSAPVRVCTV